MGVYKDPRVKKNPWYYHLETKDPITGKRKIIKKRGFRTREEAKKAFIEAQNEINKGIYVEPAKILYKEFFKQYLESKKTRVKSSTLETYTWLINKHIIPRIGDIELSKITPIIIQKLYNNLAEEKVISDENIQKIHTLINDSLNTAMKWGLILRNPASLVERPKATKKEIKVWTLEEAKRFLEVAKETRYYIVFLLALTTGMRQGEILGLRWKDIDFENGLIHVVQTLDHNGKKVSIGAKTKSGNRVIAVDADTLNEIKKHRELIEKEKMLASDIYQDNDLVIPSSLGTFANPRNVNRTFYNLIQKANVTKIRFHDLRHTHATLLLSQNVNPKIVSERLGHANVRITLDTYSHLLPNMQKETAEAFGEMFYK